MARISRAVPTLLGMSAILTGCSGGVLDPQGPIAAGNAKILLNSLAIMLVIVIPTLVALLFFAWKYRASNSQARYDPEFVYSGRIELIVWGIPTLTILFLGGLIYYGSQHLDPRTPIASDKPQLNVQVVALDWKWLFIYPDQQVATVNNLVIPAGVPVHFTLTSASVMNAFFIPQLGSMIYVMNGMRTELHLQADHVGTYYGQSAHFSGDGFSDMHFLVHAVPAREYGAFLSGLKADTGVLNADLYRKLAQQGSEVPASVFGHAQQGLFDAIVRQALPPGPGRAKNQSGGEPAIRPKAAPSPTGSASPTPQEREEANDAR
ncbi:ubiquinol oxidase subunit II [Mesorhizobium sp. B2-1-8]|uniref:ubiquinol oxidase subunit II n=1 Tax=unclassified Mesorhizobium TaxID=325217 RepID=UPI001CCAEE2F|nr:MULTISPECIES: ubiquinol oxidase subunit II [unclassified Mesorhizobium]MBZ9673197.1 ubiquinol oxidase subunit II [Mesorhizobium sp. ES1-3]MBZ9706847.1 ubiquinol oxidase subunit II [Mesorhizobium sp. ESP7-2]UCI18321.1 ubiquinol oxidase subunit II [Mesorhizobium sp. B2-1-8]